LIKARHNIAAAILYKFYIGIKLRINFDKFILLNKVPDFSKCNGLIITPNHFSWWDGFLIEFLMRKISKRKLYILMLEEQLRKFWFFKYLGAFSIKPESLNSIKESLNYSKTILNSASNFLAFYPQGEIQKYETENLKLKRGLLTLTDKPGNCVSILTFKITTNSVKKSTIYCKFGSCFSTEDLNSNFQFYEEEFIKNIKLLDSEIIRFENQTDIGINLFNKIR